MLITTDELAAFSGVVIDSTETAKLSLRAIYIGSATDLINNYLGVNVEDYYEEQGTPIPNLIKKVCLEISTLIQLEEGSNIGVNSTSDIGGVSRTFLNIANYDKYLSQLSIYRVGDTLSV